MENNVNKKFSNFILLIERSVGGTCSLNKNG